MIFSGTIRRYLGWCPDASARKTRIFPGGPEPAITEKIPVPAGPAAPPAEIAAAAEHRPEYQANLLLIAVLLFGVFYAFTHDLYLPFSVLAAVLVYFDAENIHAGRKFEKVSLLGEVASWEPIVWATAVFIGSVILFALYLLCREEVYTANT